MSIGQLSPDGNHYWNGQAWAPAVSEDGQWRWDGKQWLPTAPPVVVARYLVPAAPGATVVVAPKNPAVSLIVSFFIPGVGSMVNGDTVIGVVILL